MSREIKTGLELIIEERRRQVKIEGWTAEHDKEHSGAELAKAAATYAWPDADISIGDDGSYINSLVVKFKKRRLWPFESNWYKPEPRNRIRELAKAGALIAAEIDRLNSEQEVQECDATKAK